MQAYAANQLSAEDRVAVDKLLAEDPFASDAMEGFMAASDKTQIGVKIANINQKIRDKTSGAQPKSFNIHWTNYAWAAALLGLLIGIGFVMVQYLNKPTNELALGKTQDVVQEQIQTEAAPQTVAPVDNIATESIQPSQAAELKNTLEDAAKTPVLTDEKKTLEKSTTSNQSGSAEVAVTVTTPTEANKVVASKTDANSLAGDAAFKKSATLPVAVTATGKMREETSAVAPSVADIDAMKANTTPSKRVNLDEAMKSFNSGDYASASQQFDQILKREPDNGAALYFGGITDYINGKNAKAEKNFDKLLKDGNQYVEGSKWYKSNLLLKKGKKDDAKKLLKELVNSDGSYKERAVKKLEELKP